MVPQPSRSDEKARDTKEEKEAHRTKHFLRIIIAAVAAVIITQRHPAAHIHTSSSVRFQTQIIKRTLFLDRVIAWVGEV